jgi:hypothetical protein
MGRFPGGALATTSPFPVVLHHGIAFGKSDTGIFKAIFMKRYIPPY